MVQANSHVIRTKWKSYQVAEPGLSDPGIQRFCTTLTARVSLAPIQATILTEMLKQLYLKSVSPEAQDSALRTKL